MSETDLLCSTYTIKLPASHLGKLICILDCISRKNVLLKSYTNIWNTFSAVRANLTDDEVMFIRLSIPVEYCIQERLASTYLEEQK